MMAVAAWQVRREHGFAEAGLALLLFVAQLGLNTAWSGIFFGLRRPGRGRTAPKKRLWRSRADVRILVA